MRTESLNHKFVYGSQITVGRLVSDVADSEWRGALSLGEGRTEGLTRAVFDLQRSRSARSRTSAARTVWVYSSPAST